MKKSMFFGLVVLCAILAIGRDLGADQGKATIAESKAEDDQAELQKRLRSCNNCHVEEGARMSPSHPYLDGQHKGYLVKQLKDFISGERDEHVMAFMAEGLSDNLIEQLATIFSEKKPRSVTVSTNQTAIAQGKKVYFEKREIGGVTYSCDGCHGPKAQGDASKNIPVLTGQKTSYLHMALFHFKHQLRANDADAVMRKIAAGLTDAEILAVTEYLTTIK